MNPHSKVVVTIIALILLTGIFEDSQAQQAARDQTSALITDTRVAAPTGFPTGILYATIRGKERKIATGVLEAWIIRGGRSVVYSAMDGSGGFENEGQSLRIYDARTGKRRKILSEYYGVNDVDEVTTTRRKTALLVAMTDGGLGASYLGVVDPDRGEVFFRRWAQVVSQEGDVIVIGFFKEDDWDTMISDANAKVIPYKTERHNLNTILRRRLIVNKRQP
jgi:hypothetical protein